MLSFLIPFAVIKSSKKEKKKKKQSQVTPPRNSTEEASSGAGSISVQNEILCITFAYRKREGLYFLISTAEDHPVHRLYTSKSYCQSSVSFLEIIHYVQI